jgi:hypothetical protein
VFTLSIVLEERDEAGQLRGYYKHEITDPEEAVQLIIRYRVRGNVADDWREAGRRARGFFLRRWAKGNG